VANWSGFKNAPVTTFDTTRRKGGAAGFRKSLIDWHPGQYSDLEASDL